MSFDDVYQTNEPANEKGDLKVATDERSRLTGERVFPIEHTNIRTMSLEFKTKKPLNTQSQYSYLWQWRYHWKTSASVSHSISLRGSDNTSISLVSY